MKFRLRIVDCGIRESEIDIPNSELANFELDLMTRDYKKMAMGLIKGRSFSMHR